MVNNIRLGTADTFAYSEFGGGSVAKMTDREQKMNSIGEIWNGSQKLQKQNKKFEKTTVRQLNRINRKLRNLNNQVNEELQSTLKLHQELKEESELQLKMLEVGNKKKSKMDLV